jgi:predicted alpha/beta-hydrolase family hydrolase
MLFLQGTRDELAPLATLRPVLAGLARATLHVVDDADHGFHVRKKSGRDGAAAIGELAEVVIGWAVRTRIVPA